VVWAHNKALQVRGAPELDVRRLFEACASRGHDSRVRVRPLERDGDLAQPIRVR
jgi:hypothetical protein